MMDERTPRIGNLGKKKKKNFGFKLKAKRKNTDNTYFMVKNNSLRTPKLKEVLSTIKKKTNLSQEMSTIFLQAFQKNCFSCNENVNLLESSKLRDDPKRKDLELEGWLNKANFTVFSVNSLGIDKFLAENLFRVFDLDNNGVIDLSEFLIGIAIFLRGNKAEQVALVFKLFDIDKTDTLSYDEILHILTYVYSYNRVSPRKLQRITRGIIKNVGNNRKFVEYEMFKRQYKKNVHLKKAFNFLLMQEHE